LILDDHDLEAFSPISHLTVGSFRDWLLSDIASPEMLKQVRDGITPEMAAAVSKIMRNQDLILVAKKCEVKKGFRNTIGLPGHLSTRLQPNHPTDDLSGIAASILDGLLYANGDAVIGINPATDDVSQACNLIHMMNELIQLYDIPTQSCVLTHVTNTIEAIEKNAPVDLVFQSIGGTQATNDSFGFNIATLAEAQAAALSLGRGTVGNNVMYFETGQGSSLSANAHHQLDQQTCEARAYAVARKFDPLLVGCTFIMGIPGSDDIMLNYQTTSFHDAMYARSVLNLKPAPEFYSWLRNNEILMNEKFSLNKKIPNVFHPEFDRLMGNA